MPDESRATVAPVLDDLKVVEENVRRVRKVTGTGLDLRITRAAGTLRIDVGRFARTAEKAGLERCGREAEGNAAADAVAMPSYAAAVAEQTVRLAQQFRRLRRFLGQTATTGERLSLWKQMAGVVESIDQHGANETPHRVEKLDEQGFSYKFYDLEALVDDVAYQLGRGDATKARRKEAAAFRLASKMQAHGIELLEATGPPGRKLLPDVRREVRRGP